jgi:hypothetical protein
MDREKTRKLKKSFVHQDENIELICNLNSSLDLLFRVKADTERLEYWN